MKRDFGEVVNQFSGAASSKLASLRNKAEEETIRSAKLFLENFDLMVENCKHTYEAKSISDQRDEKGKMFFIVQCKICQESGTLTLSEDAERFFNPVQWGK